MQIKYKRLNVISRLYLVKTFYNNNNKPFLNFKQIATFIIRET